MADDDKKTKNTKTLAQSRKLLKEMGIDPEQMARESKHELMVPKMALVGVFDTIQKFCDVGKNTIIGSVGPLNVKTLRVFFAAMKGSLDMAEKTVKDYQEIQLRMAAKETVDALARVFREEDDADPTDIGERDTDPAPPASPGEEDGETMAVEDLELEEDEDGTPDPDDTSGFGGSFEKFKKSGKLVN